jgi:hypothetical protein
MFPTRKPIQVDRLRPGANIQEAAWFFSMEEDDEVLTNISTECQSLYGKLVACRKKIVQQLRWHPQDLSTNCALRNIALTRPSTTEECMRLRGLDPKLQRPASEVLRKISACFCSRCTEGKRSDSGRISHSKDTNTCVV